MNKSIEEMTRKDFAKIQKRKGSFGEDLRDVKSIVLIPTRRKDDSGFVIMDYVAYKLDGSFIYCGGGDVFHLGGIGGLGYDWIHKYSGVPAMVPPCDWNIDCLPASGYLRLFSMSGKIICGPDLSSMEIYCEKGEKQC
jgi:hypothetical protein